MMDTSHSLRLAAVAMLCLCQPAAFAQEPPVEAPPPAADTPAAELPDAAPRPEAAAQPEEAATQETAVAEAPALTEMPASADAPAPAETPAAAQSPAAAAPVPGAKRIVMLPVEFTVYQKSVAGIEAVPDWSETARFSLAQAAIEMLKQDNRFQVVDAPQFDGETDGLLREHVELFKIVGESATSFLQWGGKPWADKKTSFDYTIGDGLQFLADASGADYAFLLAGAQITQTGGAAFMQFLAAAGGVAVAGGGTFMFTGIVDLRSGDLKWLNSRMGQQMFGITGSDVRNPATAAEIVTMLFEGFPSSKLVNFPAF
jgi:hypothetical protein